jgi:hypothetical protein
MFTLSKQPESVGRLFSKSFQVLISTIVKCLPIFLFFIILIAAVIAGLIAFTGGLEQAFMLFATISAYGEITSAWIWFIGILLILFLVFWSHYAIVLKIESILFNHRRSFGQLLVKSLGRGIIVMFCWLLVGLGYGIINLIIMHIGTWFPVSGVGAVLSAILFLLYFYIIIKLIAWSYLILTGTSPIAALKNSTRLVKNNWWRSFAILVIPSLVYAVIIFGFYFLSAMFMGTVPISVIFPVLIIEAIVGILIGFSFVVWYISLRWLLINDLKLREKASNSTAA